MIIIEKVLPLLEELGEEFTFNQLLYAYLLEHGVGNTTYRAIKAMLRRRVRRLAKRNILYVSGVTNNRYIYRVNKAELNKYKKEIVCGTS